MNYHWEMQSVGTELECKVVQDIVIVFLLPEITSLLDDLLFPKTAILEDKQTKHERDTT